MKNLFSYFAVLFVIMAIISGFTMAREVVAYIPPPSVDTVKKPSPVITQPQQEKPLFVLVGSEDDFRAIIKILDDPEPSHRDVQTLRNWILKNTRPVSMPADTSKQK